METSQIRDDVKTLLLLRRRTNALQISWDVTGSRPTAAHPSDIIGNGKFKGATQNVVSSWLKIRIIDGDAAGIDVEYENGMKTSALASRCLRISFDCARHPSVGIIIVQHYGVGKISFSAFVR